MPRFSTENIRNIALVGPPDGGKTTLAESLLLGAGTIPSAGSVERGDTVCDFDPMEQQLQHSLDVTLCSFDHRDGHVNLLDTPGYPDFAGRALGALAAVDSVAVVIDATAGVDQVAQRMMGIAGERGLGRLLVINKIDLASEGLEGLLEQLQALFGTQCLPINLPAAGGETVVDCYFTHGDQPTLFSSVEQAHTALVDQIVELDEEMMQLYLEQGEELSPAQLHAPFEAALRQAHLIPVCFTSARNGAGVAELLDIFARLMPNPLEGNPPLFYNGTPDESRPVRVHADPERHVVGHVFKISVDPYIGRLGFCRIHQGTLASGAQLFIGDARKSFKAAHVLKAQGKQYQEAGRVVAGDLCVLSKVDDIVRDAVIHDDHEEDLYFLKPLPVPPPMCGLAIQPLRHGDEQKLSDALSKLSQEDPGMRVEHRPALNETVLYGAGDLHLRVILARMREQYHVDVETRPPSIAYRETITQPAEGHHRHKKQTGGAGQFGEVFLRVEPLARGAGFEFVNRVVGGAIPSQFIPAVEKGVRQVLEEGAIAGYPLQDLRVTVYDGKHHSVDSKEIAFVSAGKKAFLDAVRNAGPLVLEPIVNLSILAPNHAVGDISGDIASRRGMIQGTEVRGQGQVEIRVQAPLSELEGYQSRVKSLTGGEGSYTLAFSRYDAVPGKVQKELMAAYRPGAEED